MTMNRNDRAKNYYSIKANYQPTFEIVVSEKEIDFTNKKIKQIFQSRKALLLLTSYASSLFVCHTANAEEDDNKATMNLLYSQYKESNVESTKVLLGSNERYEIDVTQVNVFFPVTESWAVSVDRIDESLSGASPWYTQQNTNGDTVVAMTGATIYEDREDTSFEVINKKENITQRFLIGYSTENDYKANYFGWTQEFQSDDKNQVWTYSLSHSNDVIKPTQNEFVRRPTKENKTSSGLTLAWSQVINPTTIINAGIFHQRQSGYLTDPYKLFDVNSPLDSRPSRRESQGLEFGLSKHVDEISTSLHGRYRYYTDNWNVSSHTLSIRSSTSINSEFDISFEARLYAQNQASFYVLDARNSGDDYFSTDYRLSSYDAQSLGVVLDWFINDKLGLSMSMEQYQSKNHLGLVKQSKTPSLVDFTLTTLQLVYSFE